MGGALGAAGVLGTRPALAANSLRVGALAPVATLVTLDGARLSTADMRGQVVILTFLATWCVPCRDELPLLSAYQRAQEARGLRILGLSLDAPEALPQLRTMAAPLAFPVGLLSAAAVAGYGRIWRIPVSFTIDRGGRLADDGWRDRQPVWTAERLQRVVEPLLAAAA
jgi:cytochrome c biogenesis protein CcmG, thiol:disulfide interchange protein DsbE